MDKHTHASVLSLPQPALTYGHLHAHTLPPSLSLYLLIIINTSTLTLAHTHKYAGEYYPELEVYHCENGQMTRYADYWGHH